VSVWHGWAGKEGHSNISLRRSELLLVATNSPIDEVRDPEIEPLLPEDRPEGDLLSPGGLAEALAESVHGTFNVAEFKSTNRSVDASRDGERGDCGDVGEFFDVPGEEGEEAVAGLLKECEGPVA
jgi:hypothetical protein